MTAQRRFASLIIFYGTDIIVITKSISELKRRLSMSAKESEIVIKDIRTLVDAILNANESMGINIWWRGQRKAKEWSLKPSIFREPHEPYHEVFISKEFMLKAPARHMAVPKEDDLFGWLFMMQHYGLPTRLLDWTESPLVAAYFAVESSFDSDADGCLYALQPGLLNSIQGGASIIVTPTLENETVKACVKPAFDEKAKDVNYIIGIAPTVMDIRIMAQLSMFTLHGSNLAIEDLTYQQAFLIKFLIPYSAKSELFGQLSYGLGIREANLFPDLEHLAREIKSHRYMSPR